MLTRFLGIAFTCLLFVCLEGGSQIIITSNSGKIKKFGATQALVLKFLPQEALCTMPKQHNGDTLVSDSQLSRVTNVNMSDAG